MSNVFLRTIERSKNWKIFFWDFSMTYFYSIIRMSPKNTQMRKFMSIISNTMNPLKKINKFSLNEVRFTKVPNIV